MAKKALTKEEILEAKINTYLEIKAQFDELEEKVKALKADLAKEARSTEARTLVVGSHTVTVAERTRKTISVSEFTAAHPRLAAKFTKETRYDVVTIK